MTQRRWHWQIEELGAGPDYVLKLTFDAATTERLHALVKQHLPPDYVANDITPKPARHAPARLYSGYVDRRTYETLQAALTSAEPRSSWFYGEIEVVDNQVTVRHVLAGGMYDESDLIGMLATTPDLTLTSWHVAFAGYEWGDVASGGGAAELLDYLRVDRMAN